MWFDHYDTIVSHCSGLDFLHLHLWALAGGAQKLLTETVQLLNGLVLVLVFYKKISLANLDANGSRCQD